MVILGMAYNELIGLTGVDHGLPHYRLGCQPFSLCHAITRWSQSMNCWPWALPIWAAPFAVLCLHSRSAHTKLLQLEEWGNAGNACFEILIYNRNRLTKDRFRVIIGCSILSLYIAWSVMLPAEDWFESQLGRHDSLRWGCSLTKMLSVHHVNSIESDLHVIIAQLSLRARIQFTFARSFRTC